MSDLGLRATSALGLLVMIAIAWLFSADRRFTHHLRLNVGHPGDKRIDGAIRTLGELAAALT